MKECTIHTVRPGVCCARSVDLTQARRPPGPGSRHAGFFGYWRSGRCDAGGLPAVRGQGEFCCGGGLADGLGRRRRCGRLQQHARGQDHHRRLRRQLQPARHGGAQLQGADRQGWPGHRRHARRAGRLDAGFAGSRCGSAGQEKVVSGRAPSLDPAG